MKQGFALHPQAGRDGSPDRAGVLHDVPRRSRCAPSCRSSPRTSSIAARRRYALFLSLSGLGSIVGALTVAALGNVRNKGRIALTMLICLGAGMSGFALSTSLVAELRHAVPLRRRR